VAHDLGCHALADLRLRAPVLPEPPVRVRVHVDEPRRQDPARRPERRAGRLAREVPDRRDDVVADADVGAAAQSAGAVDHLGAFDLEIKHGFYSGGHPGFATPAALASRHPGFATPAALASRHPGFTTPAALASRHPGFATPAA